MVSLDVVRQLILDELERAEGEDRWPGLDLLELVGRLSGKVESFELQDAVRALASESMIAPYDGRWHRPIAHEALRRDSSYPMGRNLVLSLYSLFSSEASNDGYSREEIERMLRVQGATFSQEAFDWCLRRAIGFGGAARLDEGSGLYYPRVPVTLFLMPVAQEDVDTEVEEPLLVIRAVDLFEE
jgi:hypothetical protein